MSSFHDRTKSNEKPQYWKMLKERTHYQLWNTLPQICYCQCNVLSDYQSHCKSWVSSNGFALSVWLILLEYTYLSISVFLFYFLSVLLIRFASIAFRVDSIFASLSFCAFCSSIRSWNSVFFRLSTLLFIICSQILEKNNRVIFATDLFQFVWVW